MRRIGLLASLVIALGCSSAVLPSGGGGGSCPAPAHQDGGSGGMGGGPQDAGPDAPQAPQDAAAPPCVACVTCPPGLVGFQAHGGPDGGPCACGLCG